MKVAPTVAATAAVAICINVVGMSVTARAAETPAPVGPPVVVTASRFPESSIPLASGTTVITAEDIRNSPAKSVPDLLSQLAGISVRDLFGNHAAGATVDMRGFGASASQNTLVLVDGRRVSDADLSGVQWSSVPLGAIERIEVVRGAGAVLYGDGAVSGVINIITRSPLTQPSGASIEARYGSYDTREFQIHGNRAGNTAGFSVQATDLVSGGYRDNNRNRLDNVMADLYWLPGLGELTLKLAAARQGIRLPGARQIQPSANRNEFISDPRGAQTPLDYSTRDSDRAMLDWRVTTGFGEFNLSGSWRGKEQTSYFDFGGFPNYRVVDLNVVSLTPRARIALPVAGLPNTLVVGVDWYRWDYRLQIANAQANASRPINTIDARQQNTAFYLQDTLQIARPLALTVGARQERVTIDATDRYDVAAPGGAFGSGAPPGSRGDTARAYEIGLRYQFAGQTAVSARSGSSFRFANVDEIYETSAAFTNQFQFLRPQKARTHELGFETQGSAGRLRAAIFTMEVRDEIHLDPFTNGTGNTNLPPSRRRGAELEGQWRVSPALTLGAAYGYLEAKFLEGVLPGSAFTQSNVQLAGRSVPLVPRNKVSVNVAWSINGNTRLSAVANYVGAQFMDNDEANTLNTKIPSFTVADVKLTYRRGPWTVAAAINNVFDRKYYNYAVRSQFVADRYNLYPLPERNASISARYEFR